MYKVLTFSLMADECVDVSNKEQLVICLRWVDHCLDVHEDFLGLYHIPDTSANTITGNQRLFGSYEPSMNNVGANVTMERSMAGWNRCCHSILL